MSNPRPFSATRLAAFYSIAFALVAAALGYAIYAAMRVELRQQLDQRLLLEAVAVMRDGGASPQALATAVDNRARHGSEDMRYALFEHGRLIAGPQVDRVPTTRLSQTGFAEHAGDFDMARTLATPLAGGRLLIVGTDPESIERTDDRMVPIFIVAFGLMVLIAVSGGMLMHRALRRRLDAITGAAEAIIAGKLSQRMPVSGGGDEFDRLSATLNRMLDRIEALMANVRQVSGDIAHDLRTPLSRMRQKLELASGSDPVAMRAAIDQATGHADDLLALFTGILAISEVEAGGALRLKPLDLSALVDDIAESYVPAVEDAGSTLIATVAPGIAIAGQRELIAQLLVNLLDNALRHTPAGTRIAVTLASDATLTVADDGPGIAPEDRARVFERFVRLDASRTTPGHGLGLRLVSAIAAAHGATIALDENHPGVTMMIRFPRHAA